MMNKDIRRVIIRPILCIGAFVLLVIIFAVPKSTCKEERSGTSVSLGGGLAAVVRDDGELWIWNAEQITDIRGGKAQKLDDQVIAACQVLVQSAGEKRVFLGVLYEDLSFKVWEKSRSDSRFFEKPEWVSDNVARFQVTPAGFSLVKTDGTLWWVTLFKPEENTKEDGRSAAAVKRETALTQESGWKKRNGPISDYQISRTEDPQYYILTEKGKLWGKGENGQGQLGGGKKGTSTHLGDHGFTDWTRITRNIASVYTMHDEEDYVIRTLAVKTDNSLWGWGYVLLDAMDKNYEISIRPVKVMDRVRSASIGWDHDLILGTDGRLFARGSNRLLQLGTGSADLTFSAEPIKVMDNVRSICASRWSSYAVKGDGSLWSWGQNDRGQLGHGTIGEPEQPMKILNNTQSVTALDGCAAAVREDGSVWIWGDVQMEANGLSSDKYLIAEPICIMEGNVK